MLWQLLISNFTKNKLRNLRRCCINWKTLSNHVKNSNFPEEKLKKIQTRKIIKKKNKNHRNKLISVIKLRGSKILPDRFWNLKSQNYIQPTNLILLIIVKYIWTICLMLCISRISRILKYVLDQPSLQFSLTAVRTVNSR